jgi:PHD/YefM family antitoxin component YafN of YafNO toxin-antitoxin module
MTDETDNLVSAEEFRKGLDKYLAAARNGSGALAVTVNSEVVGFFLAAADYEAMMGTAVKELLSARSKGPTIKHSQVRSRIRKLTRHLTTGAEKYPWQPRIRGCQGLAGWNKECSH